MVVIVTAAVLVFAMEMVAGVEQEEAEEGATEAGI